MSERYNSKVIPMTNRKFLRVKLAYLEMSERELAEEMGCDYGGLLRKLNNRRYFSAYDIYIIGKILKLQPEEILEIFFSPEYLDAE